MAVTSDVERIVIEEHAKRIYERTVPAVLHSQRSLSDPELRAYAKGAYRAAEQFASYTRSRARGATK
jgi:hypothetical protein